MIRTILLAAAAFAAFSGPAGAQALGPNPPTETTVCLDVSGQTLPVVCKTPGSRLDKREDICVCPAGARTIAPVCPKGVEPPSETVALNRARRTAGRDGTLVGDLFEGKPMCVELRKP